MIRKVNLKDFPFLVEAFKEKYPGCEVIETSLVLNEDVDCEQFDYELSEVVKNAKKNQFIVIIKLIMAPSSSGKDAALSRRKHGFEPRWGYQ